MSYPYRTVLYANIGQWASVDGYTIPSDPYFEISHLDEVTPGGIKRSNIFVQRDSYSGTSGVDTPSFSLGAEQQIFLRRYRVASAMSNQGLMLWQKGKIIDDALSMSANFSYFKLDALKLSDSTLYSKLEHVYTLPQLNEWQDINKFLWKTGELGTTRTPFYLAASEFVFGFDGDQIATEIVGELMDLRIEFEVDL